MISCNIKGCAVTVVTDHANLRIVLLASTPTLYSPTAHKFRALLQPWLPNLTIVYKPGRLHTNVDSLSRLTNSDLIHTHVRSPTLSKTLTTTETQLS